MNEIAPDIALTGMYADVIWEIRRLMTDDQEITILTLVRQDTVSLKLRTNFLPNYYCRISPFNEAPSGDKFRTYYRSFALENVWY